jgi:hypothetical protein
MWCPTCQKPSPPPASSSPDTEKAKTEQSSNGTNGVREMGPDDRLSNTFGNQQPSQEMVPFFDVENKRIVRIPASELRSGAIQVRLQGSNEVVWALPEQLRQSKVKHPEFDEGIRAYIRQIQAAFAEQRPISIEEWEDGFRRDANPEQEIALWSYSFTPRNKTFLL